MIILMAFTVMLGIHVALRSENSRLAAINALGTVFFLSVGTIVCIDLILINGRFEYQWLSFAGFIVAGIGGLWWVLSAERPSAALNLASASCPIAVFYTHHQHPDRQAGDRRIDRPAGAAHRHRRRVRHSRWRRWRCR